MRWLAFLLSFIWVFYGSVALAQRLAIKSNVANIRSGPGKQYDILWQVEKYHPILIIDKNGKWYRFRDFEGDEGWIHVSLVGEIPAVITKSEKNNVRSGPGPGYKIKFTVEKGIPFRVLQRKNKWVYVRHADGDKGWIHTSLLW
jgi:SH3-like domain-containing protein